MRRWLDALADPGSDVGSCVEGGGHRFVRCRSLLWQEPDLPREAEAVVVDGVVLQFPLLETHDVASAEFDPAPSGVDPLEGSSGERAGRVPLDDGVPGITDHLHCFDVEVGQRGEDLGEEATDRIDTPELADCDEVVDHVRVVSGLEDGEVALPKSGEDPRRSLDRGVCGFHDNEHPRGELPWQWRWPAAPGSPASWRFSVLASSMIGFSREWVAQK